MNDNYNELFKDFEKICKEENVSNLFSCINLSDLRELNTYLNFLIDFVDNLDEDILYDTERGLEVINLARLADNLFQRDYEYSCLSD